VRNLVKPGELQSNQLILVATFQYRVVGTRMGTVDSELIAALQKTFQVRARDFAAARRTARKLDDADCALAGEDLLWLDTVNLVKRRHVENLRFSCISIACVSEATASANPEVARLAHLLRGRAADTRASSDAIEHCPLCAQTVYDPFNIVTVTTVARAASAPLVAPGGEYLAPSLVVPTLSPAAAAAAAATAGSTVLSNKTPPPPAASGAAAPPASRRVLYPPPALATSSAATPTAPRTGVASAQSIAQSIRALSSADPCVRATLGSARSSTCPTWPAWPRRHDDLGHAMICAPNSGGTQCAVRT